jgi:hypothetical protein
MRDPARSAPTGFEGVRDGREVNRDVLRIRLGGLVACNVQLSRIFRGRSLNQNEMGVEIDMYLLSLHVLTMT